MQLPQEPHRERVQLLFIKLESRVETDAVFVVF